MNALPVIVTEEIHTAALRAARAVATDFSLSPDVLNAPLDEETTHWISRIWDQVESALGSARRNGVAAAKATIDKVGGLMAELTAAAFRRAEEVRAAIAERLRVYLESAIDAALLRVRASITIGGRELRMKSVTVNQRITISGSVKASLEELCQFVAEGELSLTAQYSAE